jgi:ABC-2 type transport system permease protein
MRPALHAEWTKMRTVASPLWLLLGAVVLTVAAGASVTAAVTCPPAGCFCSRSGR